MLITGYDRRVGDHGGSVAQRRGRGEVREFATESGRFNLRVAGVCLNDGHVLLHTEAAVDFWVLPGGRPLAMEPTRDALRREMREELAVPVETGRLLWVVENFFAHEGVPFHELGFYYEMFLPDDTPYRDVRSVFAGHEGTVELDFRWFALEQVATLPLRPAFLKSALRELPAGPVHVVQRDEERPR
jgi:8-oxo-dGTP pyrophosphatase MutT (NUDIX family)